MGCTGSKQARRDRRRSPSPLPRSLSLPGRHVVALTSSTLGSLRLDPTISSDQDPLRISISRDSWSDMVDLKIPKSPTTPPSDEPETINAWELMAGLEDPPSSPPPAEPMWMVLAGEEDSIIADFNLSPTSPAGMIPSLTGIVKERINAFQEKIDAKRAAKVEPSFKCPPGGEEKVVFYFTSLRGVRKTYEDCSAVRAILKGYNVRLDERDVSMHGGFKEELNEILGPGFGGSQLPRVFANGVYIGGVEEVRHMHDAGELGKMMEGCRPVAVGKGGALAGVCAACGDVRFVPCELCSGSCKVFVEVELEEEEEEEERFPEIGLFRRCPECNENGLVRCPICCC